VSVGCVVSLGIRDCRVFYMDPAVGMGISVGFVQARREGERQVSKQGMSGHV